MLRLDEVKKLQRIRHHLNQTYKLETAAMVVISMSIGVMSLQSMSFVAEAMVVQSIVLNGGEELRIGCRDGSRPKTSVSGILATVGCALAAMTPAPTQAPQVSAAEVVDNFSFDSGNSGWQNSGAVFGSGMSKLTGGQGYVSQKINQKLQNGKTYVVTAQLKVTNPGTITWGGPQLGMDAYADLGASSFGSIRAVRTTTTDQTLTFERTITDNSKNIYVGIRNFGFDGAVEVGYVSVKEKGGVVGSVNPTTAPMNTNMPVPTGMVMPTSSGGTVSGAGTMSMAMMAWGPGTKNPPGVGDKCSDGTSIVAAHNAYYVVAYDGYKYPSWHPPVVVNPITGVGTCTFGHEHGRNPADYQFYDEIAQNFGKDLNGNGTIEPMRVAANGVITPGDRAGLPFGLANEHMDMYYNQEKRDSIFVRHEDHVGHKIEFVNGEADMTNNSTHVMGSNTTGGVNIPYTSNGTNYPTGVKCAQLHKIHQGTWSADAVRNNLHELVVHSKCFSTVGSYPGNTLILTGMIPYGKPGEYIRFCAGGNVGDDRYTHVCADGGSSPNCTLNDPLISKLPSDRFSNTLGRNMVDRSCLDKLAARGPGTYFGPYEIWEGTLNILAGNGKTVASFGRQWEVLDPIRYVDSSKPGGIGYNSLECNGLLKGMTPNCDGGNQPWDSVNSPFKGLSRSMYMGRNYVDNSGGTQTWWTDPLGGNATANQFTSGLKQVISTVNADMQQISLPAGTYLNDRAIKRQFDSGNGTVHAPN